MRSTSYVAFALCALSTTVFSAPVPQSKLTNIIGSITNPSVVSDNVFEGNGNNNANGNGNDNEVGNHNGNNNEAVSNNEIGNDNTLNLNILKARKAGLGDITNTILSVTEPAVGSGNSFQDNGNGNGNGNGNDNDVGNNNGNGNEAASGNEVGNGNTINILKERKAQYDESEGTGSLGDIANSAGDSEGAGGLGDITNTLLSITAPTAGSGNSFLGNLNGNGNDNGNGNSVGNGNANGNLLASGNEVLNGNTLNLGKE
ncbi:hypothetical protein GQ44DRAFT_763950 [Phaeosphaeriaceae sp. PMI808]|nr:hypothetical protein GQ44DRAFT_763950 [Phaeosphaeriaceae sp. PMI808]